MTAGLRQRGIPPLYQQHELLPGSGAFFRRLVGLVLLLGVNVNHKDGVDRRVIMWVLRQNPIGDLERLIILSGVNLKPR